MSETEDRVAMTYNVETHTLTPGKGDGTEYYLFPKKAIIDYKQFIDPPQWIKDEGLDGRITIEPAIWRRGTRYQNIDDIESFPPVGWDNYVYIGGRFRCPNLPALVEQLGQLINLNVKPHAQAILGMA